MGILLGLAVIGGLIFLVAKIVGGDGFERLLHGSDGVRRRRNKRLMKDIGDLFK